MASLSSFNRGSETLIPKPTKPFDLKGAKAKPHILAFQGKRAEEPAAASPPKISISLSLETPRRAAIGLGLAVLTAQVSPARAEQDGLGWIDGPIPVPKVSNKIANEETGTRSFVRPGIFMANIGPEGSQYRLWKYAFELLALGDLIGKDSWNYMRKYLRLKSTVMFYDFDTVISAAADEEKQPLTDLANRLFDNLEKLEDAVKKRKDPEIVACYEDTTVLLHEVMTRMA